MPTTKYLTLPNYQGTVISDFYSVYHQFKNKQKCWFHLIRKSKELIQQNPTKLRTKIHNQLNRIYQEILFFKSNPNTTQKQREEKAKSIQNQLIKIIRTNTDDKDLKKVLNLINKHADQLVACILNPDISPDNNSAERALRPAVISRKLSGGSKSPKGALTYEINLSVIETLRKQKQLFPAMKELILNYITSNE